MKRETISIWQVNNNSGEQLGVIQTEASLDIIDVQLRANNLYPDEGRLDIVYIGDVKIVQ